MTAKEQAIELRRRGVSIREVERLTGIPRSTVSELVGGKLNAGQREAAARRGGKSSVAKLAGFAGTKLGNLKGRRS
jgi:predicted transcriptional regulator